MHKCYNCGQEFEGNFCPECGTRRQEEKRCPQCGKIQNGSSRFCSQCGYSFTGVEVKVQPKPEYTPPKSYSDATPSPLIEKLYPLLGLVPIILLAVFSVLLYAFLSGPLAVVPKFGDSYGSIYTLSNGMLEEMPELSGCVIAIILFTVLCFLYTAFVIAVRYLGMIKFTVKFKKVNIFGKCELNLIQLLEYSGFLLYFIFFLLGCILSGKISAFDQGMGVITAGACPILLIVFSLIFAIAGAGALTAKYFLAKKYSVLTENEKHKEQEQLSTLRNYLSKLSSTINPVVPQTVEKPKLSKSTLTSTIIRSKRKAGLFGFIYLITGFIAFVLMIFAWVWPNYSDYSFWIDCIISLCLILFATVVALLINISIPIKRIKKENLFKKALVITVMLLNLSAITGCLVLVIWDLYLYEVICIADFIIVALAMFIYSIVVLMRVNKAKKNSYEQINVEVDNYETQYSAYRKYKKDYREYLRNTKEFRYLSKLI